MVRPDLGACVFVVSHARPGNVAPMTQMVGPATWIVGQGEAEAYRAAGAAIVAEGGPLCASRNLALETAFAQDMPCVQLSDDLVRLERAVSQNGGPWGKVPLLLADAVADSLAALRGTGAKLAGAAPTSNLFYFNPKTPLKERAFVVGDFMVIAPSAPRFDETLRLKEDYDFTLQHLAKHGRVARLDWVLATWRHGTNAGGAVEVRTAALEQESIARLRAKWGKVVVANPKRPNEVLLKFPRRT